jgi:hypothetical protein
MDVSVFTVTLNSARPTHKVLGPITHLCLALSSLEQEFIVYGQLPKQGATRALSAHA